MYRIIALSGLLAASLVLVQTPARPVATPARLTDYVGAYADGPNHRIEIVIDAKGQSLPSLTRQPIRSRSPAPMS